MCIKRTRTIWRISKNIDNVKIPFAKNVYEAKIKKKKSNQYILPCVYVLYVSSFCWRYHVHNMVGHLFVYYILWVLN